MGKSARNLAAPGGRRDGIRMLHDLADPVSVLLDLQGPLLLDERQGDYERGAPTVRRIELRRLGARFDAGNHARRQGSLGNGRDSRDLSAGPDLDREADRSLGVRVLVEALLVTGAERATHPLN